MGSGSSQISSNYPSESTGSSGSSVTISSLNNITTIAYSTAWTTSINVTLGGDSTLTCGTSLTATSSNAAVVSGSAISFSGNYPSCVVTFSFGGGVSGTCTITLNAANSSSSASTSFDFTLLPSAVEALSLRQVVLGYTGYALRAVNSTNNAVADVSFDSNAMVSAASNSTIVTTGSSGLSVGQIVPFSTFSAGASVSVSIWYDQSGNSNHALQATLVNQPGLATSGSLLLQNGLPSLQFTAASSQYLTLTSYPFPSSSTCQINMVVRGNSTGTWSRYFDFGSGTSKYFFATPKSSASDFRFRINSGSGEQGPTGASAITDTNDHVISFQHAGSSMTEFKDGTQVATASGITNAPSSISGVQNYIGKSQFIADPNFNGNFQEFILFSVALTTAQRQTLEHAQESYYSISGI